ncbi:MAG TPA: hypothetical protein VFZ01_19795 [Geminicoccaceae bacterium]
MERRALLRLLVAATVIGVMGPTMAHTPYRQWQVYRQKHLLIGTHKADPLSYEIGRRIAAALAERLPESRARVTRGPDAHRLASLLTTGQLDVVLLSVDEVEALARGAPPFELYGRNRLLTLAGTQDHHLVVRPDFPVRHAWQIAAALPPMLEPVGTRSAPLHPGVLSFLEGGAVPDPAPDEPLPADHRH